MHARFSILSILVTILVTGLARPVAAEPETSRWSVGTSVWMVANALPDPGDFYYVEVDRRIDARNSLVVEALTWKYHASIGIPWVSSSYGDASEDYPGFVRSVGVGVGWRRDLWRGLAASGRAIHMFQRYHEDEQMPTSGYQLFLQARLGWRFATRAPGIWVEPSIAFNAWPLETGRPASFKAKDDRWPSYFVFEPWLNVGAHW